MHIDVPKAVKLDSSSKIQIAKCKTGDINPFHVVTQKRRTYTTRIIYDHIDYIREAITHLEQFHHFSYNFTFIIKRKVCTDSFCSDQTTTIISQFILQCDWEFLTNVPQEKLRSKLKSKVSQPFSFLQFPWNRAIFMVKCFFLKLITFSIIKKNLFCLFCCCFSFLIFCCSLYNGS